MLILKLVSWMKMEENPGIQIKTRSFANKGTFHQNQFQNKRLKSGTLHQNQFQARSLQRK